MPRKTIVTFQAGPGVEDALRRFVTWAGIPIKDVHNLGVDVDGLHRFAVDAELWAAYCRSVTTKR